MKPLLPRLPSPDEPLAFLMACHRRMEERIASLFRVVDALRQPSPSRFAEAVEALESAAAYFQESAPRHAQDEEHSLFPRILARDPGLQALIEPLVDEHSSLERLHGELREIASVIAGPNDPSLAMAELARVARAFADAYAPHIRCEDERLFPRAAALLLPEDLAAIAAEIQARRA
jgi:iron-sulfur cluster repair protein YtfE (RIC family)